MGRIRREALEIAAELRRNASNAWVGIPGWHFDRIRDRLVTAQRITDGDTITGLLSEVDARKAALLELLLRIEVVLGDAAEVYERQYAAMVAG